MILCECLSSVFTLSCRSLPNLITLALNASLISSISSSDQLLSTIFITYIVRYERSYPFRSRRPFTSLHLLTSYDLLTNGSPYTHCFKTCANFCRASCGIIDDMFLCYCPVYRGVPLKVNDFRVCKLGIQSATYKSAVVSASMKIFISVYMEDIAPGSIGHVYERFDVLVHVL